MSTWIARRAGLDCNPLRRASDRVEAWSRLAMAAAFLIVAPVLGVSVGTAVHARGVAAERLHPHPATAYLLVDAAFVTAEALQPVRVPANARWVGPDRRRHVGLVMVEGGTPAGATVRVWTDANGNITNAPQDRSLTDKETLLASIAAVLALLALVAAAQMMIRLLLDRVRLAGWQRSWRRVEPTWTGRARPGR